MTNKLVSIEEYHKYKLGLANNAIDSFFAYLKSHMPQDIFVKDPNFKFVLRYDNAYGVGNINRRYFVETDTVSEDVEKYFKEIGPISLYVTFG